MNLNTRISLGIGVVFIAVVATLLAVKANGADSEAATQPAATDQRLVRPDSHVLSKAADGKVTFVEFLDFECEACRAAFPAVEKLRQEYAGKVTFVVRYFPIQSHFNAERSARAVEAAAQQGKFEAMYKRMYETQEQWGERQVPADAVFRGFAKDLGLDLTKYDLVYADPATLERIRKDAADGESLGITGTPSFFLNGRQIQPQSYEDLTKSIDEALAK